MMLKLVAAAGVLLATIPLAQADGLVLPDICKSVAPAMNMAAPMAMDAPADEAHAALMAGMDSMNSQMESGMRAGDIDVAFVCGMLPHHQGAIDMAKAELTYGDDPWAKQLAQTIIDAQTKEIAAMLDWLSHQPQ